MRRNRLLAVAAATALLPLALAATGGSAAADMSTHGVDHIVVIYEENHSFDNLYGTWGSVNGQHVNGLADASATSKQQVSQSGTPLKCLYQNDVNLTTPVPLPITCTDSTNQAKQPDAGSAPATSSNQNVQSHFGNGPFSIDGYIKPGDKTCPAPGVFAANGVKKDSTGALPGGCTEDLVHRFYQEQWQVDGGKQDRYVAGSDAVGLSMGHYDTTALPIYQYLHSSDAPRYVLDDNFFQGGWGGSFLNHQMLVAAQAPVFPSADKSGVQTGCSTGSANCDLHSVVDANGFPNNYPYYAAKGIVKDQQLTEAADANGNCAPSYTGAAATPTAGILCGDYAINTIQPYTQPYSPGTAVGKRLPLLHSANIGDELSTKNVSWAWYSGGWDNAAGNNGRDALHPLGPGWTNGTGTTCADPNTATGATFPNCADKNFQYHHQPFGYFANYADGTVGRVEHLKDEANFLSDAKNGNLPAVSFVKPVGSENEHPGYASESEGSDHLVELLKTIAASPQASSTMVVITYDEFGGTWDHVAPPGTAADRNGVHDVYGPGTRVPALVIDPSLPGSGVDHTSHDTTSILATIEHRFGVSALTDSKGATTRDARVQDLFTAFDITPASSAPCRAGGGSYGLRISPSYAKTGRTGSVTLSARLFQAGRNCQSGLRVGLYARGQGASTFHLSRVLVSGDQGLVATTYERPIADFRWYVAYAGVNGPSGLVQVR